MLWIKNKVVLTNLPYSSNVYELNNAFIITSYFEIFNEKLLIFTQKSGTLIVLSLLLAIWSKKIDGDEIKAQTQVDFGWN